MLLVLGLGDNPWLFVLIEGVLAAFIGPRGQMILKSLNAALLFKGAKLRRPKLPVEQLF